MATLFFPQACYGILKVPTGSWLCRTCALGVQPKCLLCPKRGGALKPTRSGTKWVHVSCALWTPEVSRRGGQWPWEPATGRWVCMKLNPSSRALGREVIGHLKGGYLRGRVWAAAHRELCLQSWAEPGAGFSGKRDPGSSGNQGRGSESRREVRPLTRGESSW